MSLHRGSIALSSDAVPCRVIAPIVEDNAVLSGKFVNCDPGNLSPPVLRAPICADVQLFVIDQVLAAYSAKSEVTRRASGHGLQATLHKMMQVMA